MTYNVFGGTLNLALSIYCGREVLFETCVAMKFVDDDDDDDDGDESGDQVYLQHTAQNDVDDAIQRNINSELDTLLSVANRYAHSADGFPLLADNHFCPGTVWVHGKVIIIIIIINEND